MGSLCNPVTREPDTIRPYWCLFCGHAILPDHEGVYLHDPKPHPISWHIDEERVTH